MDIFLNILGHILIFLTPEISYSYLLYLQSAALSTYYFILLFSILLFISYFIFYLLFILLFYQKSGCLNNKHPLIFYNWYDVNVIRQKVFLNLHDKIFNAYLVCNSIRYFNIVNINSAILGYKIIFTCNWHSEWN